MRFAVPLLSAAVVGLLSVLAVAGTPSTPAAPPAAQAPAAAAGAFTDAQKTAIESVVRELLTSKEPSLILKAMQEVKKQQETEMANENAQNITKNLDKLYNDASAPIEGNPKGDVTVVQFFDYQCGYCKVTQDTIHKLLNDDKNLKFVYKEYPILGDLSTKAAKAALASVKQGKYLKFHNGLLGLKDHLTEDSLFKTAKESGLDVAKLKKDMEDKAIDDALQANQALGSDVGARGTPTFLVGDKVYPGAVPYEQLKQSIADVRKAATKK